MRQYLIEIEGIPQDICDRDVTKLLCTAAASYMKALPSMEKIEVKVNGARLMIASDISLPFIAPCSLCKSEAYCRSHNVCVLRNS